MIIESVEEFIERKKPERQGKEFFVKDITRKGRHKWRVESITMMPQSNVKEKVFVIERIKYICSEGDVNRIHQENYQEYRFCYWIVGKIGNKNGKWTWGQYSPHIPLEDFPNLIKKAKDEGTICDVR